MWVFNFDGTRKRILNLPQSVWPGVFRNYDADHFFYYNIRNFANPEEEDKYLEEPYFLISKKNGEVKPLHVVLKKRFLNSIVKTEKTDGGWYVASGVTFYTSPVIKNGNKVVIADWAGDTIFYLEKNVLKPLLAKSPSALTVDPPVLFSVYMKTNRYTFMASAVMDPNLYYKGNQQIPALDFMYDHFTGEICSPRIVNKDYDSERGAYLDTYLCELPENYGAASFPVSYLKVALQKGQLSGKLKEIALQVQEDDNPVLMLVKFKQ